MLKKSLLAISVTTGFVLSACQSMPENMKDVGAYVTGVKVSDDVMAKVKDNVSTQDDVIRLVGQPARKDQVGAKESWYFDYSKISHLAANESETTVFQFNAKRIVIAHFKTGKPAGTSGNALLDAARL